MKSFFKNLLLLAIPLLLSKEIIYLDYHEGLVIAKQKQKPVCLLFTGLECENHQALKRVLEESSSVETVLEKHYVSIHLYVDDRTKLEKEKTISRNGQRHRIRTVGQKWSHLQEDLFGTTRTPFLVIVDEEGKQILKPFSEKINTGNVLEYLKQGVAHQSK